MGKTNAKANAIMVAEENIKVVKQTKLEKSLALYDEETEITETGIAIPVDHDSENNSLKLYEISENAYGVGEMDNVPASMAEYTTAECTLPNEFKRVLEGLDKARFMIRLGIVNIGKQIFILNSSRMYKKYAGQLGLKDKTFDTFCADFLKIPVSTAYRYMDVYRICSDLKGNIDKRIVALTDTQLYALRNAGAKYADICGLLDTIELYESEPSKIPALVEKVRADAEKRTADEKKSKKKSKVSDLSGTIIDAVSTDSTDSTDSTESTEMIRYKGAIKGQSAISIPVNLKGNKTGIMQYLMKSDIQLGNVEHKNLVFEVFCNTVTDYIIVHDTEMNNILTFYYKHGDYQKK